VAKAAGFPSLETSTKPIPVPPRFCDLVILTALDFWNFVKTRHETASDGAITRAVYSENLVERFGGGNGREIWERIPLTMGINGRVGSELWRKG